MRANLIKITALCTLLASPHLASAASGLNAQVSFRNVSQRKGTATMMVKGAYFGDNTGARKAGNLKIRIPLGLAKQIATAAKSGTVSISTGKNHMATALRVVAGSGKNAIILQRMKAGGFNGQPGSDGVFKVQYGLGTGAKAYWMGRTVPREKLGPGLIRGSSSVSRTGTSTLINPTTLKRDVSGTQKAKLQWYTKPARSLVTNPKAPLSFYSPWGRSKDDRLITNANTRIDTSSLLRQLNHGL